MGVPVWWGWGGDRLADRGGEAVEAH
eukprot:COSAG05_NODE_25830_length_191_cov_34.117021_1_plen_25_part_10